MPPQLCIWCDIIEAENVCGACILNSLIKKHRLDLEHFYRRVADWHASLNNKMGGDMKKIQTVGNYFVEVWKAVGMEGLNEKVLHLLL